MFLRKVLRKFARNALWTFLWKVPGTFSANDLWIFMWKVLSIFLLNVPQKHSESIALEVWRNPDIFLALGRFFERSNGTFRTFRESIVLWGMATVNKTSFVTISSLNIIILDITVKSFSEMERSIFYDIVD